MQTTFAYASVEIICYSLWYEVQYSHICFYLIYEKTIGDSWVDTKISSMWYDLSSFVLSY